MAGFKKTYFAMGNAGGAYAACGWPILSFTAQRCSVCWGSALRHFRGREVLGQKVINSGGTRMEKTIKLTVLLKMMLVAIAAMIFGHEDCQVIMELFAGYGFRFKRQGMIRGFRL